MDSRGGAFSYRQRDPAMVRPAMIAAADLPLFLFAFAICGIAVLAAWFG
jgi:hypothetical protein